MIGNGRAWIISSFKKGTLNELQYCVNVKYENLQLNRPPSLSNGLKGQQMQLSHLPMKKLHFEASLAKLLNTPSLSAFWCSILILDCAVYACFLCSSTSSIRLFITFPLAVCNYVILSFTLSMFFHHFSTHFNSFVSLFFHFSTFPLLSALLQQLFDATPK